MAQLLRIDTETLDEKLEGLIFNIARIPELFPAMFRNDEGELLHAAVYGGQPPLVVWFTFDANAVHLRFITRALPEDDAD